MRRTYPPRPGVATLVTPVGRTPERHGQHRQATWLGARRVLRLECARCGRHPRGRPRSPSRTLALIDHNRCAPRPHLPDAHRQEGVGATPEAGE